MVAENYCYKPLARALREILASGDLGEVRFVQPGRGEAPAHVRGWRDDPAIAGGGALFEGGIHWIDLLANLGLDVETVHGFRPGDGRAASAACCRGRGIRGRRRRHADALVGDSVAAPRTALSRIYGTRGSRAFESNGLFVRVTGARPRLGCPASATSAATARCGATSWTRSGPAASRS